MGHRRPAVTPTTRTSDSRAGCARPGPPAPDPGWRPLPAVAPGPGHPGHHPGPADRPGRPGRRRCLSRLCPPPGLVRGHHLRSWLDGARPICPIWPCCAGPIIGPSMRAAGDWPAPPMGGSPPSRRSDHLGDLPATSTDDNRSWPDLGPSGHGLTFPLQEGDHRRPASITRRCGSVSSAAAATAPPARHGARELAEAHTTPTHRARRVHGARTPPGIEPGE
jgi:hypothetical protein